MENKLAKTMDQVENALIRAAKAEKDIDLIVCLRALLVLMEDRLKNGTVSEKKG